MGGPKVCITPAQTGYFICPGSNPRFAGYELSFDIVYAAPSAQDTQLDKLVIKGLSPIAPGIYYLNPTGAQGVNEHTYMGIRPGYNGAVSVDVGAETPGGSPTMHPKFTGSTQAVLDALTAYVAGS